MMRFDGEWKVEQLEARVKELEAALAKAHICDRCGHELDAMLCTNCTPQPPMTQPWTDAEIRRLS